MKICFPIRDLNGKEFTSVDEVMSLINSEAHGTWLLGANGLWHGGIHISDITQPFSALNKDAHNNSDPIPLQFMADGTVVAYRVNDFYQTAPYCGKPLRFSTSFVLVKSVCQPDSEKNASWLEFYSLYMHLAAVEDYPKSPYYKVSAGHNGISVRKYIRGNYGVPEAESTPQYSAAYNAPAAVARVVVNDGDRFVVSRTGRFYVTRRRETKLLPFGLSRLLKNGKLSKEQYWITLDAGYVERDGEMYDLMPGWMNEAVAKGVFNSVVNTDGSDVWKVSAGSPVGFMGLNEVPGVGQLVEQERFVHLEVISVDSKMPAFLSNPASVTTGGKLIRTIAGKKMHLRNAEANPPTFTASEVVLAKGALVSRESTSPVKDAAEKWWFKVSDNGWMPQADIEEIEQYDLLKQGFYPLAEDSDGDIMHTFMEGWVSEAFGQVAEVSEGNNSNPLSARVPEYYRTMMGKLDENKDGRISADEIRRALSRRDPQVRNIIDRLVIKHHSEWIGGPSEERWKGFYKLLDKLSIPYCTKWQSGHEWMSQVGAFKDGKPIWHMHPILYLSAIKSSEDCFKLIWGKTLDERLGEKKACLFRKKVISICADLWGEEKKLEYANTLMACIAVETSRLFTSSVVMLSPVKNELGEVLMNSQGKAKYNYQPVSKEALIADTSIAKKSAVGLIQFTGPAVRQINSTHGLNVTKQQLSLMDEIEQLDYVKLYFTSNMTLLRRMKTSDDIYLYIFSPIGVGKDDNYALYSKQRDIDEGVTYYRDNSSLDSSKNGNSGNDDGVIQRKELLSRLTKLREEGTNKINECRCKLDNQPLQITKEPSGTNWINRFPTSSEISDLTPGFEASVTRFISAIKNAGGAVRVSATHRPSERAYLMHYSWRISREGLSPEQVPEKEGVNIDWTHRGNIDAATTAARNMVNAYRIVFRPALTSRHIQRRAIDMTITNIVGKSIAKADGSMVIVNRLSDLNPVGSSYGVIKLISDPPHWSDDGR